MGTLYYGDNLEILREHVQSEFVDLVTLDPPFNSNASYNVLFRARGEATKATRKWKPSRDTWHWNAPAEKAFDEVMSSGNADAAGLLRPRAFTVANIIANGP